MRPLQVKFGSKQCWPCKLTGNRPVQIVCSPILSLESLTTMTAKVSLHICLLFAAACVSCVLGDSCSAIEADELQDALSGDSLLQHTSRQLQNKSAKVFPKGFSSFANAMLGRDRGTMQSCGSLVQEVMTQTFSNPTQAAQIMASFLANSQGSVESIKCLKMALDYADQHALPEDCILENGQVHSSCCVYEKRCSATNPLDGCPSFVFPPRNIFDPDSSDVTCVGSNELSPVATGVCKCKGSKVCVKDSGKNSRCV